MHIGSKFFLYWVLVVVTCSRSQICYNYIAFVLDGPEHISSTSTRTVIFGNKEADEYKDVSCVFRSFPTSEVTWARDPNDDNDNTLVDQNIRFINITNDDKEDNAMLASGEIDFTYTVNGGVVINDVNYDDAGKYVCTATNDYSTASESIQLRVRSKYILFLSYYFHQLVIF